MQRILVVDDSELMRTLIKHALARLRPFEVLFASNGQDALEVIAREGTPALVLLDINMPVMDGLGFLQRLTSMGLADSISVVIVSTEGKEQDVLRGLQAGAKAYLRKPFTAHDLHDLIGRVLA